MKSMTGYAKRQCNINGRAITVEIKSLNSKQMDANVKVPLAMREYELEIRTMVNKLERGKIDLTVSEEPLQGTTKCIDSELAATRYEAIRKIAKSLKCEMKEKDMLKIVLQQPSIWENNNKEDLSNEDWGILGNCINEAIDALDETRLHEGEILKEDFVKHIDLIEQYLYQIPQYEQERIATAKERMRSWLKDAAIKDVDENRFEQELIYYLEKLDITEEKVRLAKHINYFREVMNNEDGSGKKLGFIAQEMGREINTTGSKANHVEIQKLVVAMKDELEKIKDQLGNIL
ncbi:MAG: YicC family protein [Bacteroidales bacterium]|nr:YicC family protein [Bacteroidales bacterium]